MPNIRRNYSRGGVSGNCVIIGLNVVNRNIACYQTRYKQAIFEKMIELALVDIETEAKNKLTNDGHVDTGRLRSSIHTEYQGNKSFNYTDSQGNRFNGTLSTQLRNQYDIVVGTNVEYSKFIERLDSFIFSSYVKAKPNILNEIRTVGRNLN